MHALVAPSDLAFPSPPPTAVAAAKQTNACARITHCVAADTEEAQSQGAGQGGSRNWAEASVGLLSAWLATKATATTITHEEGRKEGRSREGKEEETED